MTNMGYVYGAMLLHSVGKEVNEESLKKIIEASGANADPSQIKALIASLEGVNIDDAIKAAAVPVAVAAPATGAEAKEGKAEKKKEEKVEEEKGEEEAASGLASLFG